MKAKEMKDKEMEAKTMEDMEATKSKEVATPKRKTLLSVIDDEGEDTLELKVAKTLLSGIKSALKGGD